MRVKLETLTARYIAGLIYEGRIEYPATMYYLEHIGAEMKMEKIDLLLEEMETVDAYYKMRNA